jgi:two-component system response regulator
VSIDRINILMAEDDQEDQFLVKRAFEKAHAANRLTFVNNGEELMRYLRGEDPFTNAVRPDIVLLDLNMPRMDGREALAEMKGDAELRQIPVVILTTSDAEDDIARSYNLGASSYIQKPVTFEKLVGLVQTLGEYWLRVVKLPGSGD